MRSVLITGGNAGIGKATAIALARAGDKVVIAYRNKARGKQAVQEIKAAAQQQEVYGLRCDLASFESIKACAKAYRDQFGALDILINNAGLITDKLQFTKEGFEMQIGVNHLGHFLLTKQLIDLLEASPQARIINVSSDAHYRGKMRFDSFKGEIGAAKYKGMTAYAQSKLANILFTKELARRYPSICSHSLHPGVVSTSIAGKNGNKTLWKAAWKLFSPFMLKPADGAKTTVYLATSAEALKSNGKYFVKQKEKAPDPLAEDASLAVELWEKSELCIR